MGLVDNEEGVNLCYFSDCIKVEHDAMSKADMDSEQRAEIAERDELERLKQQYLFPRVSSSGFPEIQKYVLVSSANSFTQWHTDFSGSAVWYSMVEGFKYFYVIWPSADILEKYR